MAWRRSAPARRSSSFFRSSLQSEIRMTSVRLRSRLGVHRRNEPPDSISRAGSSGCAPSFFSAAPKRRGGAHGVPAGGSDRSNCKLRPLVYEILATEPGRLGLRYEFHRAAFPRLPGMPCGPRQGDRRRQVLGAVEKLLAGAVNLAPCRRRKLFADGTAFEAAG